MTDSKTLTWIEHLTELRKRLIVMVVALVIGMGVAWNFSGALLEFVQRPLTGHTYLTGIKKEVYLQVKELSPALYGHYKLEQEIATAPKRHLLNYSAPLEPFFVQCKLSMMAGLILVLPVIFHQVWLFIAPGLTARERRMVVPVVAAASLAFCVGAAFFLTVIWPVIINFSLSYEAAGLQGWFNITAYINFCLRLILVFGLIFELPVLTLVLTRFGLVSYQLLAPKRKYALLASSIVAAFHADLITMFVIMIPMYLMYEISIWTALIFGKREKLAPVPVPA
ncbi:twin-arginine translocase subunit TatC [Geomonas sp. RF6]|uniref:twin-arginine translocase subunit TatC n=1 Tax=Geomonas sp. RF6 TaxID=2897342 RepID=UPI001E5BC0B6|nr:twin-arginine translocase subunit TatC [Geomonas sp. RF6]UFS70467.1 twin-arginine translocase subunit TatC [Geomonas sp. RF6]